MDGPKTQEQSIVLRKRKLPCRENNAECPKTEKEKEEEEEEEEEDEGVKLGNRKLPDQLSRSENAKRPRTAQDIIPVNHTTEFMAKGFGNDDFCSGDKNVEVYEMLGSRMSCLNEIMEALIDPNIYMIGVCGKDNNDMGHLLERVMRRGRRDDLFAVSVMVSINSKKPNLRSIQQDIADELNFSFQGQEQQQTSCRVFTNTKRNDNEVVTENARQLCDRIRREPKILFILRDLQAKLDLAKLGIPFGVDHNNCKLILTSQSEEMLSNRMNAQRIYRL